MHLTREANYAIRCILYLSRYPGKVCAVTEIAKSQGVPRSFVAKILQKLVKSNIVSSRKGAKGGFILNKSPSKINILNIIEAVQGPLCINICVMDSNCCPLGETCPTRPVWLDLQDCISNKLKAYDFQMLIDKEKM
jgi:Rrf2 family protein